MQGSEETANGREVDRPRQLAGLLPGDTYPGRWAETQIRRTFENVALTLAEVQMGWTDVVEITSYHVSLQQQSEALLPVAAEFLESPYPAWTAVGVIEFFEPEAVVEISCVAVAPG